MAASVVKICSGKKGKSNGPRSQESRVYLRIKRLRCGKQVNRNFGIKPFLSQNWGHVFTPKFGKKNAGTRSFQDCVIKESIA